jgi:hypothetical protein
MRAYSAGVALAAVLGAFGCGSQGVAPPPGDGGTVPPAQERPPTDPPATPPPLPPPPVPPPPVPPPPPPPVDPPPAGPFEEVARAGDLRFLGVGSGGTAFAVSATGAQHQLLASADGRSWSPRGAHPSRSSFLVLAPLASGTLLADVAGAGGHALSRSADGGRTWTDVLPLGAYRLLTPRNVAELGGEILLVEYQSFTGDGTPITLFASDDDGRTWTTRNVLTGHRHGHGLKADPATGALWIFMGDRTGGTLLSYDGGRTTTLVRKPLEGGVFVDAAVVAGGILAGHDSLFAPLWPHVVSLGFDGAYEPRFALPGPSYSFFTLPGGGGYLVGAAHEAVGDVYVDGAAHLFHSPDGERFDEIFSCEPIDPTDTARGDVYFTLPSGEAVVMVHNCVGFGSTGRGYALLRRRP